MRRFATVMGCRRRALGVVMVLACLGLTFAGCAKKPQKDAFIEHWQTQSENSQGYSPTARPRKVEFEKTAVTAKKEEKAEAKPPKPLPKQKVTLRMYDTDLVAVLRAMARAANQNLVLSSSIPGAGGAAKDGKPLLVNVNVVDAPWDETFQSLLASNGLAYVAEGDIVRVMTLEDMDKQNKLKEARNKLAAETVKAKELEPYDTCKVEVNFADLDELAVTLNALCGNTSAMPGLNKKEGSVEEIVSGLTGNANEAKRTTNIDVSNPGSAPTPALPALGDYKMGLLKGFVIPDHYSNSLVIQASREDAEKMIKLIEKLDQPRPQIRLKAFIVQTSRETAQQLGIQWGGLMHAHAANGNSLIVAPAKAGATYSAQSSQYNITGGSAAIINPLTGQTVTYWPTSVTGPFGKNIYNLDPWNNATAGASAPGTNTVSGAATPYFGGGMSGQGFGLNFPANLTTTANGLGSSGMGLNFLFGKIGESVLEAQLTALAEESKVKILSSPTITTMENKLAYTENGKKIPYVSTSQNGTNVQFADALLRLEMLPHVIDGTNLRMKIVVKDDQVDANQNNWVQGNPPIFKRETRSTLVVEDGDTIVISGLTRDTVTDGESGVPFLRDIPGLGWAFKSKSKDVLREDILIFVTPTILKEKPIAPAPPVVERASAPAAPVELARP